jgi:hypothetical protein
MSDAEKPLKIAEGIDLASAPHGRPRDHYCPICGGFGPFGYGPPGWPSPERWYCCNHREIAETMKGRARWDEPPAI